MSQEQVIVIQGNVDGVPVRVTGPGTAWRTLAALFRLAKPGIVAAVVVAALAGMLVASPMLPSAVSLLAVGGIVAMAAAGAAMANVLLEVTRDRQMARLMRRCRALDRVGASGVRLVAVGAMVSSIVLAAAFVSLPTALLLGAAIGLYLFPYTCWLKRTSPFAVLIGGIPGALPPLIGAAAIGSWSLPALLLSLVIYIWQLPHFWLLALHYQEEYRRAGVPVLPLVYGERFTRQLVLATTLLLIPMTLLLPWLGFTGPATFPGFLVAGILLFACSHWGCGNKKRYRYGFFVSLAYLAVLLAMVIGDVLLARV